jgi:cytochrome d ubiquinol oxidase subunit I
MMLAVGLASLVLRLNGRLFDTHWFLNATMLMGPTGLIAMLAGWFVTEIGRQPYTVYGLLRTAESVSPIGTPAVAGSLSAILVVYLFVFGAGVWYLLKLMGRPPDEPQPVSALADATRAAGITPAAGLPARERRH